MKIWNKGRFQKCKKYFMFLFRWATPDSVQSLFLAWCSEDHVVLRAKLGLLHAEPVFQLAELSLWTKKKKTIVRGQSGGTSSNVFALHALA